MQVSEYRTSTIVQLFSDMKCVANNLHIVSKEDMQKYLGFVNNKIRWDFRYINDSTASERLNKILWIHCYYQNFSQNNTWRLLYRALSTEDC